MKVKAFKNFEKKGIKITALFVEKTDAFDNKYLEFFGELHPAIKIEKPEEYIEINSSSYHHNRSNSDGEVEWYIYPKKCSECGCDKY